MTYRIAPNIELWILTLMLFFCCNNCSAQTNEITLKSFYEDNAYLDKKVDSVFSLLNDADKVAQMIVTSAGELGKPEAIVYDLVHKNKIGGVVFLKGTKPNHKKMIDSLNRISGDSIHRKVPLIFSIDAEPSLFNGRLKGTQSLMHTAEIKTVEESDSIARIINKDLLELGFHQNFAPVCDVSIQNAAIKDRSFGADIEQVIALSKQFIETTQSQGIVATAKHFPGHGLVEGDTHKQSVYINGDLKELEVYPPLIDSGVLSIMMAHITIKNNKKYNTEDLPASCSRTIVTDLLKKELGFKGIIITDALNIMKAVNVIDNAPLLASKAGCDMLLMPIDEEKTINSILEEMKVNPDYKNQIYNSVKKIIRLKICLGLL